MNSKKKNFIYAQGRRKEASARIRLLKGKGEIVVNDKPFGQYFPEKSAGLLLEKLFKISNIKEKYFATVKVSGGGKNGQLTAVIHGLAKAINNVDREKFKQPLRKAGFLTRDSRIRERRKVGTGGRARRKKQSPKR